LRLPLLFLVASYLAGAQANPVAQCVELPYPGMPRQLWERELVWMKNIGIGCVALPDGANLPAVLAIVRKLELPAWILADAPDARLGAALEPQTESHGGPVRWIGRTAAPQPVRTASVTDPKALPATRAFFETHQGTLLWTDAESTLTPQLHRGAISFTGEEQPALSALRRQVQLFGQWQPFLGQLAMEHAVQTVSGKMPPFVSARQFFTDDPTPSSAVSVINQSAAPFQGELRVQYPPLKQSIKLPEITVPAGDALWLPVNLPLAKAHHCLNCNAFGNQESIVYATAELTQVEFENGILAFEFSAPASGEIVLHLAAEPAGPYLAAGKPRTFDWDSGAGRVRLPIPAGSGPQHRVRIGLALTAPETSAFFSDRKVLLIGQTNTLATTYSSEDVAKRSRLRAPSWLKTAAVTKSPNEIEYSITVPDSALHGSHVELTLETDGAQMSHTRLQLLRPASLRIREAVSRHWGKGADLPLDPPLVPVDQKSGRDLNITVRNNAPEIRTFILKATADDIDFAKPKTDVVIAASSERDITLRVFAHRATPGLHTVNFKLSGAAANEIEARLLAIPHSETVRYTDGDATVLESQQARVIFTAERLVEFVWKDSERNMLPEGGIPLGTAHLVELRGAELVTEGGPLALKPGKQGDITLSVSPSPGGRVVYSLTR